MLAGLRILVAEDDWLLAEMLVGTLQAAGCVVIGPATGLAKTMELAQRSDLDGALLDINLAGEMCFPAAKLLKERNVSFAFMTAYAQSAIPEPLRSAGFLGKPFTDEALFETVAKFARP
jgi:CheY-like chemotaxis protein